MSNTPLTVLLVEDDDAYAAWLVSEHIGLPDSAGLDTVRRMHAAAPGVPIVVITAHDDEVAALHAVQHGADDYLVKGDVDARTGPGAVDVLLARSYPSVHGEETG